MTDIGPQFDANPAPAEPVDRDGELLEMFARWERDIATKWGEWSREATEAFAFVAGEQWDKADIAAMEERQKVPVVFNLTAPTVDAVSGAEIQNRQQVQYYPREVGDTGVSDALTQGAEYINDECNGDQEDSEAFRDALICGVGCTLTRPEIDGEKTCIVKERIDPLQMSADPASRKACFEDARYIRREIPMSEDEFNEFKAEVGKPDAMADGSPLGPGKRATIVDPTQRYKNGMLGTGSEDVITVCEWQWWEKVPVNLTVMPHPDQPGETVVAHLDDEQHGQAQDIARAQLGQELPSKRVTKKVYYRAVVGGGEVLEYEELPEQAFRYKFITGKRDRNKGTWFGFVRAMMDPQRFTNKLYSEILHIVRTNAKGGVVAEEGAVKDITQFEDSWAQGDAITWMQDGALSNNRIQPKTAPPIPVALFQLMEFARDMVRACTGVNEEILGLVGRDQPGVLEAQRKQAAYGLLSPFFDAFRRYRRDQGTLMLAEMRLYLPETTLVRLVDKGTAQYVPLALTMQAQEYDVIVDEAASGPNQKAKVSAVLLPMLPDMLSANLIGPAEIADVIPYLDIPAGVATKLADGIRKHAEQQGGDPEQNELQKRMAEAKVGETEANAELKRATAFQKVTDAHATHTGANLATLEAMEPGNPAEGMEPAAHEAQEMA